ncbi:MAG: glycosyltransferase, partial [Bradymonadaceae bacterium]|nr:glycosyltransferase [Lujinxingiaceae bacterium]
MTQAQRIALLGPAHPWRGGIAHYNASLYRALESAGHTVELINFRALYPDFLFPGKSQRDTSDSPFTVPHHPLYHPLNPASWLHAARFLQAHAIERLVIQSWHPYFAPGYTALLLAARALHIHTTLICHNVRPHEPGPLDELLLRALYTLPDHFITQSPTEATALRQIVGPDRSITT